MEADLSKRNLCGSYDRRGAVWQLWSAWSCVAELWPGAHSLCRVHTLPLQPFVAPHRSLHTHSHSGSLVINMHRPLVLIYQAF